MKQPIQQLLITEAVRSGALTFGTFTLKSGRISPYFFNIGQLNTGYALSLLGKGYAQTLINSQLPFDFLFGPAYKGIPLVTATSIALEEHFQTTIPYCFNRKEIKDHGEGGILIGTQPKGKAVIIDDVLTAGNAIKESIKIIQQAGATISGVILLLDRQEKGKNTLSTIEELQQEFQIKIYSILTLNDLLNYVKKDNSLQKYEKQLKQYRDQYGILT